MKFPVEIKPALWGIVGGAIAAAIIGFSWGGWAGTGGSEHVSAVARVCAQLLVPA